MRDDILFQEEAVAALLGRPQLGRALEDLGGAFRGRRVLVTGAGGSVGTHLARVLASMRPATLALLDHHEHSLFLLQRQFHSGQSDSGPVFYLADVRDSARMKAIFRRVRPEIVFHLAAYKHVPLGEAFPEEILSVNVLATKCLLELAAEHGVETFVYPSSDKAVNPPSLYGATKRLGECLVQSMAAQTGRRFNVARYVNIIGTRGSVIETFIQQLEAGVPFTVTDLGMTRYWVGMREAIWLALEVAAEASPGSVLMLDAGDPLPVAEMARRLHRLLAGNTAPFRLETTGVRPGERLHEELLSRYETYVPGPRHGLLEVCNSRGPERLTGLDQRVDHLAHLLAAQDADALRRKLMAAAMELQ